MGSFKIIDRIAQAGFIFLSFSLLSLMACSHASKSREWYHWQTFRWVEENTFQVISTGVPEKNIKGKEAQRKYALERSIVNARNRIYELFSRASYEGANGVVDPDKIREKAVETFRGIVSLGKVVRLVYDEDNSCEIVYEIKGGDKDMKKMIKRLLSP